MKLSMDRCRPEIWKGLVVVKEIRDIPKEKKSDRKYGLLVVGMFVVLGVVVWRMLK